MKKYKNVSQHKNYRGCFVICEKELRRIEEIIKESFKKNFTIEYQLKFKDDKELKTDNLDDILEEENSAKEKIVSLVISGRDKNSWDKKIEIRFNQFNSGDVNILIEGELKDWVYLAFGKLEDLIGKIKKPYSFIRKPVNEIFYIVIPSILMMFYIVFYAEFSRLFFNKLNALLNFIFVFSGVFAISFIVAPLIMKTIKFLFPAFIFEIGEDIGKFDKLKGLRLRIFWSIFIASGISLIVGLGIKYL